MLCCGRFRDCIASGAETVGRPRDEVLADIRDRITSIPNVKINIGQPISHRLDHIMSGVRAQIAVKVFGPDLRELRNAAQDIQTVMSTIPGVVDLQIEPQVEISQLRLKVKRQEAARYGLAPGDVAELLETRLQGPRRFGSARRGPAISTWSSGTTNDRAAIRKPSTKPFSTRRPDAKCAWDRSPKCWTRPVPTRSTAKMSSGGSLFLQRAWPRPGKRRQRTFKLRLSRSRTNCVNWAATTASNLADNLRPNSRPTRGSLIFGTFSVLGVFLLLWRCLDSWVAALQVLFVNIPLAALGSVTPAADH